MSVRTVEMNAFAEPIDLLTRGNDTLSEKSPRQKAKGKSQRTSWATFEEILPAEGGPGLRLTGKSSRAPEKMESSCVLRPCVPRSEPC